MIDFILKKVLAPIICLCMLAIIVLPLVAGIVTNKVWLMVVGISAISILHFIIKKAKSEYAGKTFDDFLDDLFYEED